SFLVDEGAVGALEIPNKDLAAARQQGTVPIADHGAGGPQLTVRVAADEELGERNGDGLALGLARREHDKTQLHETALLLCAHPPGPMPEGCRPPLKLTAGI